MKNISYNFGLLSGVALLRMAVSCGAAPAAHIPFDVTMADDRTLSVRTGGDEFFNWVEDPQGYAVIPGAEGRWQYARRDPGAWVPAGLVPLQTGPQGRELDPPMHTTPFDGSTTASPFLPLSTLPETPVPTLAATPSPAKLLVILVTFLDRNPTTGISEWTDKFFGVTGKTVDSYYLQASKNRFHFLPAEETQGTTNDGIISVSLAINHPNVATTDDTVRNAVKQALIAADTTINYKSFDTDNNNYLSSSELHIVLVFAGYEASYSSTYTPYLWAHRWSLFSPVTPPLLDSVYVASSTGSGSYMAVGELHDTHPASIGVICHELGHNLGLPDLYDTDGSSDGVGTHCLMGAGNWGKAPGDSYYGQTPVLMSAYCRQAIGFSDVRQAIGAGVTNTLTQISDTSVTTDILRLNTPNTQQYYLVENRQLSGFDAGLYIYTGASSGGGLAIWHIDTSALNNTVDTRRLVDLEEAANPVLDVADLPLGHYRNYYYSGNATRFDETTWPSNTLNGGGASLARVYDVSAPGAQMSFIADEGVSLEAALDVGADQVITTGSPAWTRQNTDTHDSIDAAQSGTVTKNARTSYLSTVVTGPVQVAFWWKHTASATETLSFLIDGVTQASTNATMATWARHTRTITAEGAHTLRWQFTTTLNGGGSSSGAYLDQLTVKPPDPGTLFSVR